MAAMGQEEPFQNATLNDRLGSKGVGRDNRSPLVKIREHAVKNYEAKTRPLIRNGFCFA
jgi:hypothetical protein